MHRFVNSQYRFTHGSSFFFSVNPNTGALYEWNSQKHLEQGTKILADLYSDDIERKFRDWDKNQKLKGTDHPSEELSVCLWGVKQSCLLLQCELVVSV